MAGPVEQERIIGGGGRPEDLDAALRPATLDGYIGRKAARR